MEEVERYTGGEESLGGDLDRGRKKQVGNGLGRARARMRSWVNEGGWARGGVGSE